MVKWIGKFSLLLKRLRDAWMDMLPLSSMSEERRQNQNQADVTQENVERHRRAKANSVNRTPSHVTFSRVSQHTHFNVARDIGSRLKVSCACHPCVIRMLLLS